MPHIHDLIDFTIAAYVVHDGRVLLVFHKQLQRWLPLGGHIELDEDPETALYREVKEESGLDIDVIGKKPEATFDGFRFLQAPAYLDIHDINPHHKHIGMTYFARARSDTITLAEREHDAIRWFTPTELADPGYAVPDNVQFYAKAALITTAEKK